MEKLIYIAIPYTFNPELSFKIANEVSANLVSMGEIVFSPISHSHPIESVCDKSLILNHSVWMRQDMAILSRCDEILFVVIGENGHQLLKDSRGCNMEMELARKLKLKIKYYEYQTVSS